MAVYEDLDAGDMGPLQCVAEHCGSPQEIRHVRAMTSITGIIERGKNVTGRDDIIRRADTTRQDNTTRVL